MADERDLKHFTEMANEKKPKIYLVSDEEIYNESNELHFYYKEESPIWHNGFIQGAKWMRSQYED
jgi:hypothetical protein